MQIVAYNIPPEQLAEQLAKAAAANRLVEERETKLMGQFGLDEYDAAHLACLTPATRGRLLLDGKSLP